MTLPAADSPPYHLAVDGFPRDHFRVLAFTGREAISRAYWFHVTTTVRSADDADRAPLGRRAVLTWNVGPAPRAFHGVVAGSRIDERDGNVKVHLRLVPRLRLLDRRRRTRIFQKQGVPDIVTAVLGEAGIAVRWQLKRAYPAREYCTQYEETDYAFVRRLLAEAAIYFYFHAGPPLDDAALAMAPLVPGDTVVCADDATFYPPIGGDDPGDVLAAGAAALIPDVAGGGAVVAAAVEAVVLAAAARPAPTLYYLAMIDTATPDADKITPFAVRGSVRSNRAVFRDYDPERPAAPLWSEAASTAPFPSPLAIPDTGALAGAVVAAVAGELSGQPSLLPLEIYDHHGPFLFPKWAFTGDEAARMLRQARRRAVVAEGGSGCSALAAGHRFSLSDHPVAQLDGPYAVTRVDHHGDAAFRGDAGERVYACTFDCVPAAVTFVPKRPRRESVQVALTATVVGPPGEEIHVDPMGQIKVQFHWDREGRADDHSSCWIRTMHAWGGAGWGVQFIPRVGMEVVVTFEGGDPDKPMVLGALYNGTHPSPFPLPGDKSRSGFRTQTYPGGRGFNELSFEDAAEKEQVYLHAQRDHDEVVEHDHALRVGHNEKIEVGGTRRDHLGVDLFTAVDGKRETNVTGDDALRVEGARFVQSLDAHTAVRRNEVSLVAGDARREVKGRTDELVSDDKTVRVRGNLTTVVGSHDERRTFVVHAEGRAVLESSTLTEIASEKEIVLRCGDSRVRLAPDRIELSSSGGLSLRSGNTVVEVTPDKVRLRSQGQAVISAASVNILTGAAQVKLTDEVKITGSMVKLNPPMTDEEKDDPPKPPRPTRLDFKDEQGRPLAGKRFVIHLDDGSEVAGVLDADGRAELEIEGGGSARVTFPEVSDVKPR
jgi:type VI secretion system secreted protein VgrG